MIAGKREVLDYIKEMIGIAIIGPGLQGIVGIFYLLFSTGETAQFPLCQITAFGKVLIAYYQGVNILPHFVSCVHGSQPIALLIIIIMHQAIGFTIAITCRMKTQQREKVIVENLAVSFFLH